ncbi:GNAT family N-acetyltransferase [Diaminobutyricibacter tongyongensis]|uniref:GNAT family N-acetyltransferase n=2 Tax=Leifsonia tongyongensis TaxID=1268043 RepID=A0A6L9XTM7_9MICO|nr:GNAT family N-acetyltransferase [Diaminobutyricibacter tongyongensis]NEN04444.1 GNAT family N-acetyltransferase [Diaminobutyricibacter tongyongensis]
MALEHATFVNDAWSERSMRAEITGDHTYYLVAFRVAGPDTEAGPDSAASPDAIEGYAGLLAPAGSTDGDIQTIAVAPGARRQGLGRALMLTLLGEARRRGITAVFLEVRADNPGAQALYRMLGFEEIGVRPHYYQPDDVDAIVMRVDVAPARTEWAGDPAVVEGESR